MQKETIIPRRRGKLDVDTKSAGREHLVKFIAKDLDTTKYDANLILDSVVKGIVELANSHILVRVPNLGSFRILNMSASQGRNPRTGELVDIAPGKRITFRAAKSFKSVVNPQVENNVI
jgi:nucleoid DNA-binding protein